MQPLYKAAARSSNLSRAQVNEILSLMKKNKIDAELEITYTKSSGDIDKRTSLRSMDKTDFFTKEIDEMVFFETVRIGIHSAKDLPEPLTAGLQVVAMTQGLDPSDSLVLKEGVTLSSLRHNAVIATSCVRREESCLMLKKDLQFIDLRGTIEERLTVLDGMADGVVIAEAALIRLNLTHLNRIRLPGKTAKDQGRIAIVSRQGDVEMENLFRPLNFCQ